jgi:class 3 adenylate cyclase
MGLEDDLTTEVDAIFRTRWTTRDGTTVPELEDLGLGNDGVYLDSTVLYADLRESTQLVFEQSATFAAEVYKAFLHCAYKIIKAEGGTATAYDGDRIMAVFLGDYKNSSATKTAQKIKYAVDRVVNPALKAVYAASDYVVRHRVGVDTGKLLVARTTVRGNNDLVWVGPAANYAAKLAAIRGDYASYISAAVYARISKEAKFHNKAGTDMWTRLTWTGPDGKATTIFGSNIGWVIG